RRSLGTRSPEDRGIHGHGDRSERSAPRHVRPASGERLVWNRIAPEGKRRRRHGAIEAGGGGRGPSDRWQLAATDGRIARPIPAEREGALVRVFALAHSDR